jgi:hypothetical protein
MQSHSTLNIASLLRMSKSLNIKPLFLPWRGLYFAYCDDSDFPCFPPPFFFGPYCAYVSVVFTCTRVHTCAQCAQWRTMNGQGLQGLHGPTSASLKSFDLFTTPRCAHVSCECRVLCIAVVMLSRDHDCTWSTRCLVHTCVQLEYTVSCAV